jgi:hypothetical protein
VRNPTLVLILLLVPGVASPLPGTTDARLRLAELAARAFELRAGWDHVQVHLEAAARRLAMPREEGAADPVLAREARARAAREARLWAEDLARAERELTALEVRLDWLRGRAPGTPMGHAEARVVGMHLDHLARRLEGVEEVRLRARAGARSLAPVLAGLSPTGTPRTETRGPAEPGSP